ncbi:hypothetical protein MY1884_004303 [Beauveria asiatica]
MAFFAASLLSEIWETSQSNTAAGLFKPQTLKKSRSLSQLSRPGTQGQLHEGDSSDEVAQSIEHRLPYTSDKNIPELTDIDGCSQDSALPELKKPDLALRIDLAAEVDETDRSAEWCGIAQSPSVADIAACSTGSETDCTASRGTTKFSRMEEVHEWYRRVQGLELRSRANFILLR